MAEMVTYVRKRESVSWPSRMWASLRSTWSGAYKVNESSDEAIWRSVFSDGARTASGIHVTPELAFTCAALYDGVNQIASDVAKMPLNLMKRLPNRGSEVYTDAKLHWLLKHRPNPEMSSMVFRRHLTAWAVTTHGGFAEIQRDTVGRPVALWPIEPHRVQVTRRELPGGRMGDLLFVVDGKTEIQPGDMLHIQGLGYTPHQPYGVLNKAKQVIGLALAAERFGASFFGNGSTFGGMLIGDTIMSPEEARAIREVIEGMHRGPDRAHKLAVLWGGLKPHSFGVKPNEAQMNELRVQQVKDVARFLRMQPHRLGVTEEGSMSYSSVEMANLDYYTGCLLDWITLWEEECNAKLIPATEYKLQYVKHNANVFLRGDFKARMDGYAVALDKGLYSRNEVRSLEDMGPQDGEQGDWYLVQEAQVPLHMLAEVKEAAMKPDPPPNPPQAPAESTDSDDDDDKERALLVDMINTQRSELVAAISARVDAEATLSATSEQMAELRSREQAAADRFDTLVHQLENQQTEAARAEEARRVAEVAAAVEAAARAQADRTATEKTAELQVIAAELAQQKHIAAELSSAVEEAQRALAEAAERASTAEALMAAVEADKSKVEEQLGLQLEEVEQERERAKSLAADLMAARQSHLEAVNAVAVAESDVLRERQARQDVEAELETLRAGAAVAADELAVSQQQLAECEEALSAANSLRDEHARAAEDARSALADIQARLDAATGDEAKAVIEGERQAAQALVDEAMAASEAARAEAEVARNDASAARSLVAEANARVADAEARRAEVEEAAAIASADIAAAAVAREEAMARAVAVEAQAAERVQAAEQSLAEATQAAKTRDAALLAASRALIVDAMGVLVRRECSQARSKQATAQKVRTWLSGMAVVHEPICVERLTAPVRLHLALTGRADDPEQVAMRLAADHLAEFRRQMDAVVAVDGDEFHVALERMLTRWESDRPCAVADALLVEGIRHVA